MPFGTSELVGSFRDGARPHLGSAQPCTRIGRTLSELCLPESIRQKNDPFSGRDTANLLSSLAASARPITQGKIERYQRWLKNRICSRPIGLEAWLSEFVDV